MLRLQENQEFLHSENGKLKYPDAHKTNNHLQMNIYKWLSQLSVHPSGEVSNFLLEDFDAVAKFMRADTQKRKIKLWIS